MRTAWKMVCEAVHGNRGLAWGIWWNVGLLVLSLAAMPFDERKILGLNPWIKPAKFDVSVTLFLITVALLLWALGDAPELARMKWWVGWGVGIALLVEDSVIGLQSARGVRSHMNYETPTDGILFGAMGVCILISTVLMLWVLVRWFRTDGGLPPAVVWGIRLGLLMLLAGSIEGVRMVAHGSHTVGAADGGAGLAFVNWSTKFGDMRVAHFFALHALQVFPLAGMALAATSLRNNVQVLALFAFVAVYVGAVWWMFASAMRGVPIVSG